jgi:hypothetical protein
MADRALTENPAHAIDDIVRGQAGRFVDDDDTVHGNSAILVICKLVI